MEENKTPNGKEIGIVHRLNKSYWEVQFNSGGQLPPELSGGFTSPKQAQLAINQYLARKNSSSAKNIRK